MEFPEFEDERYGRLSKGSSGMIDWRVRVAGQLHDWNLRGHTTEARADNDEAYLKAYALRYRDQVFCDIQ